MKLFIANFFHALLAVVIPSSSRAFCRSLPSHKSSSGTFRSSKSTSILSSSSQVSSSSLERERHQQQPQIIVVGKIIVDEYGNPDVSAPRVAVGGGGPQAALGAALALTTRDYLNNNINSDDDDDDGGGKDTNNRPSLLPPPPPQPVTMIGPVGDDFSQSEEEALYKILGKALLHPPRFFRGGGGNKGMLMTPRIRLWHDEKQVLHWYAVNDSFGEFGAAGLWGNHPSIEDYLEDILQQQQPQGGGGDDHHLPKDNNNKPILHIIIEGGVEAPGDNGDSKPLLHKGVRGEISFLGVEPILFPNSDGIVREEDSTHCLNLLQEILDATPTDNPASVVFSPDMAAFQGLDMIIQQHSSSSSLLTSGALDSIAVRDGPKGSQILSCQQQQLQQSATRETTTTTTTTTRQVVPAATLRELVNPTGAGNAFSAAYTALRGSGCDIIDSACIATGVGAVFCEYTHCPTYSWDAVKRVAKASQQVKEQVVLMNNNKKNFKE